MSTSSPANAEPSSRGLEPSDARPERRVAINSGLLLAAFSFQALVSIVVVGIVARYLGQAGLGRYAYVISFIELFVVFADMGMNRILVRDISRNRADTDRLTSAVWTLRMLLILAVMVVVALLAANGDRELWLAVMVYFVAQAIFLLGDVFGSVFQAYQRMEYQFWGIVVSQALLLALTLGVVWVNLGLVALFAVRVLANGVRLAYLAFKSRQLNFAHASFERSVLRGALTSLAAAPSALASLVSRGRVAAAATIDARGQALGQAWQETTLAWHVFVESIPVGISLLLRSYIWRAGVILTVLWLGQQQGDLVNGVLYGPLRAVQQLRIIPAAFAAAMLPVFSNRIGERMDEFDTAFAKSIKLFTAVSLLIALAFTFLADPLVRLLLGETIDLHAAAQVLAILGWVIVLYFPNWLYGVTLVALGRQKLETLGLFLGVIAGFATAWWAIPRFLAEGVAYAILVAEAVFFVIGTAAMWDHFHWRQLAPSLLKLVLACGLTGVVFLAGSQAWSWLERAQGAPTGGLGALLETLVVGGLGLAAFVAAIWQLHAFDRDELESIRAMTQLKRGRV